MNLCWHLFRADLRVVKPLVVPLGFFYLAQLGVLLGWFGSPAPALEERNYLLTIMMSFVWMFTMMFGLIVLTSVVSLNNPSREDTFAATRPVPRQALVLAKLLLMMLVLVLPHVLTEWALLWQVGCSASEVLLGVVQKALSLSVLVALMAALAWLWRSKGETIRAYAAGTLSLVVALLLCGVYEHFHWDSVAGNSGQLRFETSFSWLRVLIGMSIACLIFWSLLLVQWKQWWSFGKRLAVGCLVLAVIMAGLWFAPRSRVVAEEMEAPLLTGAVMQGPHNNNGQERFMVRLRPGAETLGNEFDVKWSVGSAVIDGRSLRLPEAMNPSRYPGRWVSWMGEDYTMTRSVGELLGPNALLVSDSEVGRGKPDAQLSIPRDLVTGNESELEVRLTRHRFEWTQLVELPLKNGARDGGWKLEDHAENARRPGLLELSLSERMTHFWIAGWDGDTDRRTLRYLLVDDETGICVVASNSREDGTIGGWTSAPWKGYYVAFDLQDIDSDLLDPKRCRLLVFKPQLKDSRYYDWSRKLDHTRFGSGRNLARDLRDGNPDELLLWLDENPAPPADAGDMKVAKQIVEIIERTNHLPRYLPEDHPVISRLAGFTPGHFELLLRALEELAPDQHYSEDALQRGIAQQISREQLSGNLVRLGRQSTFMREMLSRGWLEPLGRTMAEHVRNGDDRLFSNVIQLRDRGGLSDEECLMVFSRNPSPWLYNQLRKIEGMKEMLDADVDQWFENTMRQVMRHGINIEMPLHLALGSGQDDAPKALHRLMEVSLKAGGHSGGADAVLDSYFEPADFSLNQDRSTWARDFLAIDPAHFEFDEKKQKYLLKKP